MEEYKQAIKDSKIPRIPYKSLLGVSLTEFINNNKLLSDDVLLHEILTRLKAKRNFLINWNWCDIVKNVKIGLSARRSEINFYGGSK
jgi:hypothetical protein